MLLNDGLKTIGNGCFEFSGLDEATIPDSVRSIENRAFSGSWLTQVRFLGATERANTDIKFLTRR